MAKHFSIPLFYVDTDDDDAIKMLTGKTVTLREAPYTTTLYTLIESVTTPGNYGADVDDKIVRLYVDGAYKEDYGTFRTYGDLDVLLSKCLQSDGEGHWGLGDKRLHHVADPVSDIDVGDRGYNDARYVLATNLVNTLPAKTLIVSDQLTAVAGKIYNTPQAAIDYAHSALPYAGNFWKIYIYPHANSSAGYAGNLTFQPNIKLIGKGLVKLSGSMSGFSQYTHFQNIMFQHSGNLTLNNSAVFWNCVARLTGSSSAALTIDTIRAVNLGLLKTHANHSIVSGGNNNVTGFVNIEFALAETDKGSLMYLPGITDFDECETDAPSEE